MNSALHVLHSVGDAVGEKEEKWNRQNFTLHQGNWAFPVDSRCGEGLGMKMVTCTTRAADMTHPV